MITDDLNSFLESRAGPLHTLALALTGSHADADDLLQLTLEKVARAWRRGIDQPTAYARKVMIRAYISERRRAHWHREQATAPSDLDRARPQNPSEFEDRFVLIDALSALPRRQREAVVLRYLEDLPIGEVASLMNCSEGNVKRCAFDGLRALREVMNPLTCGRTTTGGAT